MKVTFTNPRLRAEFDDWPSGGKRVRCVFEVERHAKRGWRFSRTTTGKPKTSTFSGQAAIVDGSDGRTYLLQISHAYGFVMIKRSDFLDATGEIGRQASVFQGSDPELHKELCELIFKAGSLVLPPTV